jgi:hypothetical protein
MVRLVKKSLCCPGSGRTIKAGRRKLSRKENGKPPPCPGQLRVHIAESGDGGKRGPRMSLKTRHFFYRSFRAAAISRNLTLCTDESDLDCGGRCQCRRTTLSGHKN